MRTWSGSASARCSKVSDAALPGLSSLAADLRARGLRVGVGELLNAHLALASVDCSSREDARLALRTVMCSGRGDLERFELAFAAVFGQVRSPGRQPGLEELGQIERAALPRTAVPGSRRAEQAETSPVPAAWSEIELLRTKDFAEYTDAEMALARELI